MEIEVIRLPGGYYARPLGCVGTIGWSPFPWELVYGRTEEAARFNFMRKYARRIYK